MTTDDYAVPPEAVVEDPVVPPPVVIPQPMTPTADDRIEVIDIIRGLALFGILAANFRGFAAPAIAYFNPALFWHSLPDKLAQAFIDTFIQGKFITIFAFLFGVGFAVQMGRAEARAAKFGAYYVRRNLLLLLIGFLHGMFVWFGDILLPYAITGLILLLFRKRKDKTLLTWYIVGSLIPVMMMGAGAIAFSVSGKKPPTPADATPAGIAKTVDAYANGSFVVLQTQRAREVTRHNYAFFPAFVWMVLALFCLGMLAWRRGFFTPSPESLPKYKRAMAWGLTIGILGNLTNTITRWVLALPPFPPSGINFALAVVQAVAVPALSLGYVCAVMVLCNDPVWLARLRRFGAVGRTALTNYLLQSILGTLIFYSYGGGLYGQGGPAIFLIPTIVIYALQVVVSPWWLARYRFGPVEWLWRTATYGKLQPMSRRTHAGDAALAA